MCSSVKPLPDCFKSLRNFEPDRLLPRETGCFVREHANGHLVIKDRGVHDVAVWMLSRYRNNETDGLDYCAHELHPKTADRKAVDWIFFMSTINFSFWTNEDYKIEVTYNNRTYSGYYAAAACVNRAIDSGVPITDPKFMKNVNVRNIFDLFQGSCEKGISFLRKAQLLIAQIYYCFKGKSDLADFYDMDQLTSIADHHIPQVLAYFMVIEYSPGFKESLKMRHIFDIEDEIVIELRATSIKAIDEIVKRIQELRQESDSHLPEINAVDIGTLLWHYRRENAKKVEAHITFLRVRSIHY